MKSSAVVTVDDGGNDNNTELLQYIFYIIHP